MKFFKPKDFVLILETTQSPEPNISTTMAAEIANAKLEREGKVVYGIDETQWYPNEPYLAATGQRLATHKALLINITPFPPCTHPEDKVAPVDVRGLRALFVCQCGATVTPNGFKEI